MRAETTSTASPTSPSAGGDTMGTDGMPCQSTKRRQTNRPSSTPIGRPITRASALSVIACTVTVRATSRRRNPSAFSTARSRRRRRIAVSSV